jgi:2-methylcitrate dehydratase PrpD
MATALVKGKISLQDFTETAIKNEDVLKAAQKVTGELDLSLNRHGVGPGRVKVVMKDGTEYDEEGGFTGERTGSWLTLDDCGEKFRECSSSSIKPLSSDNVEKVIEMIMKLEKLDDAAEPIRLMG